MEYLAREEVVDRLNQELDEMMTKYQLEDIGVFEEQGEGAMYYMGFTVRKDGEVFMVHKPFAKNEKGQLAATKEGWVIESDEGDTSGYPSLDAAFSAMNVQH